jgi:phosphatidylserine/phosphatidylglycerophosphate/cardiolipin synthase-like enzyme
VTAVPGPYVRLARLVTATTPRPVLASARATVVHARVVVADDVVSFGTVNLDSQAL